MPRPKKDYQPLNIKLNTEVADMLNDYVATTGLTKTMATERILKSYLDHWKSERQQKGKSNIL